jgi:uncharacterized protein YciI
MMAGMTDDQDAQPEYYVLEMTVPFSSLADVQRKAADALTAHVAQATELHEQGEVLMAGAFLQPDPATGYLRTMAICRSREAAERFVERDPFVRSGQVLEHRIRAWANMFARRPAH